MLCSNQCWGHLLSDSGVTHLQKNRLVCGRSGDSDVALEDPSNMKMVSSQHAVILRIGTCVVLIDTSLNGTYVNSRRVSRAVLRPNDTIRFGKRRVIQGSFSGYQFVFMPTPSPSPTTLAVGDPEDHAALRQALRCPICRDYLVFPTELSPCSHLFCSSCIEAFTLQNAADSCPLCDTTLTSFKSRTKFNMVTIIEKALKILLRKSEYDAYMQRVSLRKQELMQRQRTLSHLKEKQEAVQYSPRTGDPFLLICQTWSKSEKLQFMKGLSKHPYGESREFFCWMVRLTEEWVQREANQTDLAVAVHNLDLLKSRNDFSEDEARDALLRFIYSKQQLLA